MLHRIFLIAGVAAALCRAHSPKAMVVMDTAGMGTATDITATDMGTIMGMDITMAMIGTGITAIGVMAAGGMVAGGRTVSARAGCGHPTGGVGTAIKARLL